MTKSSRKKVSRVRGFKGSRVRSPGPSSREFPVGVIIGHAGLPEALRRAAYSIVPDRGGLLVVSNGDRSARDLDRRLRKAVARYPDSPILVFADMYGTSCGQAGARLKRIRARVEAVFGASLPLLVRFLQHRRENSLDELVRLMGRTARQQAARTREV